MSLSSEPNFNCRTLRCGGPFELSTEYARCFSDNLINGPAKSLSLKCEESFTKSTYDSGLNSDTVSRLTLGLSVF